MNDPVAIIKIKPGGLIYLAEPEGGLFDIEKYVGASLYTADAIERKDAAIAELLAALKEAEEMVVDWGAYADNYFRDKWDLDGDTAKLRAVIAKYGHE